MDGHADEVVEDAVFPALFDGFQFYFAGGGGGKHGEVTDARRCGLAEAEGAFEGGADEGFVVGDGGADADAGALVDLAALAGLCGEFGNDFAHEGGHGNLLVHVGEAFAFLLDDGDFVLDGYWVVGANLGAEPVFQRGDDAAAVGVVLGVGGGDEEQVEGQQEPVALYLHVSLLHEVEQADLDALGEVGQLVDAEDAPVGARDEPVVDGELVGEIAAFGDLDGVYLADEVGDGHVGGGELLAVAALAG